MRRILIRHRREAEPIFWVIDAEQWPRACLRAELIERGYDAYGFIEVREALNSLSRVDAPKPELIILELRGQDLTKQLIDAIRKIGVPIIVLGGNAELNDPLIGQQTWNAVLRRPVSLGTIADVAQNVARSDDRMPSPLPSKKPGSHKLSKND